MIKETQIKHSVCKVNKVVQYVHDKYKSEA